MSRVRGRKNKTAPGPERPPSPPPVGERLRQVRVGRGLDVATVAEQLHLKQCTVVALEEEDFDRLPARVFVRGYYRNYARLLGLPADELLRQFDERCPEGESCAGAPPVAPRSVRREIRSNHILVRAVTWGLALLLVVAVVLWWRDYAGRDRQVEPALAQNEPAGPQSAAPTGPPPTEAPATPSPASLPAAASQTTAPPEPAAGTPKVATTPAASAPEPQTPGTVETAAEPRPAAPVPAPEPAAKPAPPAPPKVELVVSEPSWVDIRGAQRSFKRVGTLEAGTRLTLGGEPPWHMVIGNARGVTLLVDGRPYDLATHTRRNVARLTLQP